MISWTAGDCLTAMDRTAFRRKLGERALRLPIWFHVVVNLAAVLIPLYQWVTFSGFFRRWAESEAGPDGKYDEKFIFVMLVCAFTFTAAVVTQIVAGFRPPATEDQQIARGAAFNRYEDAGVWMKKHSLKLKLAAIAIGLAAAGVHLALKRD